MEWNVPGCQIHSPDELTLYITHFQQYFFWHDVKDAMHNTVKNIFFIALIF